MQVAKLAYRVEETQRQLVLALARLHGHFGEEGIRSG
jgi:hypothetical protein